MQTQISALYRYRDQWDYLDLFGYATKGLPGLEIIGLGTQGRTIKEKLIYLSKKRGLFLPHKRYVLCVDPHKSERVRHEEAMSWLEFPLLLLLWSLAEILLIRDLSDCVGGGRVSVNGEIVLAQLPVKLFGRISAEKRKMGIDPLKLIHHPCAILPPEVSYLIDVAQLLHPIKQLVIVKSECAINEIYC